MREQLGKDLRLSSEQAQELRVGMLGKHRTQHERHAGL